MEKFVVGFVLVVTIVGLGKPQCVQGQVVVDAPAIGQMPARGANVTARQKAWLRASPQERVLMAERLGEQGATALAEKKGYRPILTGEQKTIRQGFDIVCRAPDGQVVVIEAKGGTSPLCRGYGAQQGTTEWAIKAARETLNSSKASAAEKSAARIVLEAAEQGKLTVQVIRTSHVLGEPVAAVLEGSKTVTAAERTLASEILQGSESLVRPAVEGTAKATEGATGAMKAAEGSAEAAKALEGAGHVAAAGSKLATAVKVAGVAGVAIDVGVRGCDAYHVEQRYRSGDISNHDRVKAHAKNAGGFVGGWTGAWAGAETGMLAGGAGGVLCGGVCAPVGAFLGGVAGAIGGYWGGEYVGEKAAETAVDAAH